ncbi:MAG: hypothetical protein PHF29_00695 [Candidatus Riflebacteria bacterium]|nr:hypothetical protein [Candidatus Riflebacteria bacterium]
MKRIFAWLVLIVIINWGYALYTLPGYNSDRYVGAVAYNYADLAAINEKPEMIAFTPSWIQRKPVTEALSEEQIKQEIAEYFKTDAYLTFLNDLESFVKKLPQSDLYTYRTHVDNPTAFCVNGFAIPHFWLKLSEKMADKNIVEQNTLGAGAEVKSILEFKIRCYANLYRWYQAIGVQYGVAEPSAAFFFAEVYLSERMRIARQLIKMLESNSDPLSQREKDEIKRFISFIDLEISIEDVFRERELCIIAQGRAVWPFDNLPRKTDKGIKLSLIARTASLIPQKIEALLKTEAEARGAQILEWRKEQATFAKQEKKQNVLLRKKSLETTAKMFLSLFWAPILYDAAAEVAACVILDSRPSDTRVFEFYTETDEYKKKLSTYL